MPTATVTLGRFTLKLSPLPKRELAAARQAGHALEIARLAPVASKEWFKAHSDALRFVFMAAKKNHRGLSLAELDDEAEPGEIVSAFKALVHKTPANRVVLSVANAGVSDAPQLARKEMFDGRGGRGEP